MLSHCINHNANDEQTLTLLGTFVAPQGSLDLAHHVTPWDLYFSDQLSSTKPGDMRFLESETVDCCTGVVGVFDEDDGVAVEMELHSQLPQSLQKRRI